ncbi:MAG: hypothetical protein CME71_01325 [Halobacteriovorax sp.]|nr:hypothetical protein [Halobacteriovorax sp.]
MTEQKKFITDDLEIIGIFKEFARSRKCLWAWQQNLDASGRRPVHFITIKKVDPIKKTIVVYPNNSDGFRFSKGSEIFLFCSDRGLAIKTSVRELEKDFITIPLPPRLNVLSKEFLQKIELVERENEDSNKHKRAAPRSQAKTGQLVGIDKIDKNEQTIRSDLHALYDISAGGMGFMVNDPAEFSVGDRVRVTHVDGKKLPKELIGNVVAVRHLEEEVVDTFKIGVKFG